jgi:hypothetical protein
VIELDDTDIAATAVLVVTFTDGHTETWGPAPRAFCEEQAAMHKKNPPEGIKSSKVEDAP